MPRRFRVTAQLLSNRLFYHVIMAVVVGVSGNVFIHFTFKIDVGDVPRFALQNMVRYSAAVRDMFLDVTRIKVSFSAIFLYAAMMAGPLHWFKHHIIAPSFQLAGIDNQQMSWRRMWIRLPYRLVYWLASAMERMMVAWLMYITILAHDPKQPVSWLKYMQNVRSPIRILSNPDNLLGFGVFLISVSILASVFSLMVRRPHRQFGFRGGVLKPDPVLIQHERD